MSDILLVVVMDLFVGGLYVSGHIRQHANGCQGADSRHSAVCFVSAAARRL
jgi:hypothetical protein